MAIQNRLLPAFMVTGLVLGGCSSHPPPIAESSYVPNTYNTVDVSGQWEFRVTTPDVGNGSFDALMAGVNRKAQQSCHGQYTIQHYTLYDGTEASSGFLGLTQPWIEARILCADIKRKQVGGAAAIAINEVTKATPDAAYFDIHSEVLKAPYDRAFVAVQKLLDDANGIAMADRDKGLLASKYTAHGIPGFQHYTQYVVELDPETPTTTRMTFRLLSYFWTVDEQNMIHHVPEDRDTVYERAAGFVDDVRQAVRK